MEKDKLKELIKLKAKREAERKMEALDEYLNREFGDKLHCAILEMNLRNDKEYRKFMDILFASETEKQEADFFNKVESLFYNINN